MPPDTRPRNAHPCRAALLALTLAVAGPAAASLSGGGTSSVGGASYRGNGELFLSVFDDAAKVSYTLDLGITLNEFRAATEGVDAGYQRFFPVADANWGSFLSQVSTSNLRWVVMGFDLFGAANVQGNQRLFTTLRQGDESVLIDLPLLVPGAPTGRSTLTNGPFTFAISAVQSGTFFSSINSTGTHPGPGGVLDYSVNGSSVNLDTDSGNAYFGTPGGLTRNLNDKAQFDVSNAVGASSWFYYLTHSTPPPGTPNPDAETIVVDEFDNLTRDGYWGFTAVPGSADSVYAGQYLLSFTLEAANSGTLAANREFAQSIGRTEFGGGWRVTRLPGVAVAGAGEAAAVLQVTRLGGLTQAALPDGGDLGFAPVSSVPEPGTWALTAAGLGLLAWRARRRRS